MQTIYIAMENDYQQFVRAVFLEKEQCDAYCRLTGALMEEHDIDTHDYTNYEGKVFEYFWDDSGQALGPGEIENLHKVSKNSITFLASSHEDALRMVWKETKNDEQ